MFAGGLVQPIFAPFVRQEFTAPIFLVGLAVSGYFVVRMMAEFPIGVLSDRIAIRRLLIIGRFFGIFGALACYLTTDIWVLIVARALWGVGDASFFCIGMTYVSESLPEQDPWKVPRSLPSGGAYGELSRADGGRLPSCLNGASPELRDQLPPSGCLALGVVLLVRGSGQQLKSGKLSSILPSRARAQGAC